MKKMELYRQLEEVPASSLKTIQAGRLKGKSDINPQWRYEKLTEVLGPCGFGWKFEVTKQWLENSEQSNEIAAFVNINFYFKVLDVWSDPIPANGGSMFVAQEKHGPYTSDECFKMATTDALGNAMKMIGLAADVYSGKVNGNYPSGSKYDQSKNDNDKPWLNKGEKLDAALEYLRGGGKIETIEGKYKISKEVRQALETAINNL